MSEVKDLKFCIIDTDYGVENNEPVIRLWGKKEDGKSIVVLDRNFKPYFYIELNPDQNLEDFRRRLEELEEIGEKVLGVEYVEKKLLGVKKNFVKITARNPADVAKIRNTIKDWDGVKEEYEYTIAFYKRYLIDKKLGPMKWASVSGKEVKNEKIKADFFVEAEEIKPVEIDKYPKLKILAFDIEIYDKEIIMVSFAGNDGFKKVVTYGFARQKTEKKIDIEFADSEKDMIQKFVEIVNEKDPDIIVSYNGDRFDFLRLRERAEFHKIPLELSRDKEPLIFVKRGRILSAQMNGRVHIDLFDFIEHILGSSLSSELLDLDSVARELVGVGKKSLEWKDIENFWKEKKNLEEVADYCLRDSKVTLKLAGHIIPQIFELCRIVGQTPFDTTRMTYSQLVEWLLIRNAFEINEVVLNRPGFDEIKRRREAEPYAGGYVYPPKTGIHKNIALFDFRGLYPSIIITHNVSPETLDRNGGDVHRVPGEDHFFSKKQEGFIPLIIKDLVERRTRINREIGGTDPKSQKYKELDNRQYALKILANASYGYYAYPGSRWYSRICAKSIAAWGRYYIQKVIELAEENKFDVIYGDTDSLFIKNVRKEKIRDFLKMINENLPGTMELEFKELYKSGIFVPTKTGTTAKKRYALLDNSGKILIRGFEKVRRDWAEIAKRTQEDVLKAVLIDESPEKALEIVRKKISYLERGRAGMDDLVIYTQITRPLKDYDQIGPHVAAAKKYEAKGNHVAEGSIIGYVITKGSGSISDRAEPVEYAENYDPEYYIHNQVIHAAMRVLQALGYSEEDIFVSSGQKSLGAFMKRSLADKIKKRILDRG